MGTNFYTKDGTHIGKWSAAGLYCWDCGVTLCKGGEEGVHYGVGYFDHCPTCKKRPKKEGWNGSMGRELGFNESGPAKKAGVCSCASFTWAVPRSDIKELPLIVDEYGHKYSRKEFSAVLDECPIQFTNMIGSDFS